MPTTISLSRVNFGKLFSRKTVIAEPLPLNLSDEERFSLLLKREEILNKVKEYIEFCLNTSNVLS